MDKQREEEEGLRWGWGIASYTSSHSLECRWKYWGWAPERYPLFSPLWLLEYSTPFLKLHLCMCVTSAVSVSFLASPHTHINSGGTLEKCQLKFISHR